MKKTCPSNKGEISMSQKLICLPRVLLTGLLLSPAASPSTAQTIVQICEPGFVYDLAAGNCMRMPAGATNPLLPQVRPGRPVPTDPMPGTPSCPQGKCGPDPFMIGPELRARGELQHYLPQAQSKQPAPTIPKPGTRSCPQGWCGPDPFLTSAKELKLPNTGSGKRN